MAMIVDWLIACLDLGEVCVETEVEQRSNGRRERDDAQRDAAAAGRAQSSDDVVSEICHERADVVDVRPPDTGGRVHHYDHIRRTLPCTSHTTAVAPASQGEAVVCDPRQTWPSPRLRLLTS